MSSPADKPPETFVGWRSRCGQDHGPFPSRDVAERARAEHEATCEECRPRATSGQAAHPLPWRWGVGPGEDPSERPNLLDANGAPLISRASGCIVASPYVRAVTERAGAMGALLREVKAWAEPCLACDDGIDGAECNCGSFDEISGKVRALRSPRSTRRKVEAE